MKIIILPSFLESFKSNIRLKAKCIDENGVENILFFEVQSQYKDFIYFEGCEPFILAIIPYAIKNGIDIEINCPIGSSFFFKINEMLLPIYKFVEKKQKVRHFKLLRGKNFRLIDDGIINSKNMVGTGISCGVDSLYTFFSCFNNVCDEYKINCLTYFNVGSHSEVGDTESAYKMFLQRLKRAESFANRVNLPLVTINSNISGYFKVKHLYSVTFRNVSAIYCLKKYFGKYFISSTYMIKDFEISLEAPKYESYILPAVSTSSLELLLFGNETTRCEKIKYISQFDLAKEYLDVCIVQYKNCGKCEKCRRTMLGLYAVNELDNYSKVFDIDYFYRHKYEYIGFLIVRLHWKHAKETYKEIFNLLKHNKKINIIVIIFSLPMAVKYIICKLFHKSY